MTQIMGILNITPDSFSDGCDMAPSTINERLNTLLEDGADMIDIGGESTRPGATPLSAEEEWQRLEPHLATMIRIIHAAGKRISLDTRHAATADKALRLGVDMINDVQGCRDSAMINAVAQHECRIILMHSLTVPADPSVTVEGVDIMLELNQFATKQIARLNEAGIATNRIIFDPGIGFNKTPAQSLEIIRRIDELRSLGVPLLVGHSRKSFLTKTIAGTPPLSLADKDALTLAISAFLMQKSIDILRVHHVALHRCVQPLIQQLYAPQ